MRGYHGMSIRGTTIEDVVEKAAHVMSGRAGGALVVHVGTNNAIRRECQSSLVSTEGSSRHLKYTDWT